MRGTSASSGVAGHGSSSPWDIHNTLIAAGPDLKQGLVLDTPSANVDFAATFMTLLGMALPPSVQGRALDVASWLGGRPPTFRFAGAPRAPPGLASRGR